MNLTVIGISKDEKKFNADICVPGEFLYSCDERQLPGIPYVHNTKERFGKKALDMSVQKVSQNEIVKGKGFGYRIISIVPPDSEPCHEINGLPEGIKGRVIGWVEIDPTPIPLDEEGNPINEKVKDQ